MGVRGRVGKFWGLALVCAGGVALAQPGASPAPEVLQVPLGNHLTPDIPAVLPDGFAVLPFSNRSGVKGLDWMSAAMPAVLADKLDAHPGLRRALPPAILPEGLPPPAGDDAAVEGALAVAVAHNQGARWVFAGGVRRPSWTFELTVRLYDTKGGVATRVGEELVLGEFADYSSLMDKVLGGLLAKAGLTPPAAAAVRMARVPTKDFYALTLYGRGLSALHGLGGEPLPKPAEDVLRRVVYIDPQFAEAHRLLGYVYRAAGKKSHARGQYRWALDVRPDYTPALAGLIRMSREAREAEDTLALVEQAITVRPDDLELRLLHGELLWEANLPDLASQQLGRLIAVQPNNVGARRLMVLIHASRGSTADLVRELETLIALEPDDILARLDLGAAYRRVGRDDDAIATYEAVLARSPNHVQALKFLGDLYKSKNQMGKAIAVYERALKARPNDPRPYFLLGEAYSQIGDVRRAEKVYLRAQRFPQYIADAYDMLGALYYTKGNFSSAIWYLSKAVMRRPSKATARYNYGLALSASGQKERALEHLKVAADLAPDDADVRYATGVVLLRLGKLEAAEVAFKDALVLDPEHLDALANLKLIADFRRRATEGEAVVR